MNGGSIFKLGQDRTLPKNGGWAPRVPVFGGFGGSVPDFSLKRQGLSLVSGLHISHTFEIKSLTRVLDERKLGA
jgi:hypothetical protein